MQSPTPKTQEKTLDFPDMIREVMAGAKAKRVSWANADYVVVKYEKLCVFREIDHEIHTWIVNEGDLSGTDWLIVPIN